MTFFFYSAQGLRPHWTFTLQALDSKAGYGPTSTTFKDVFGGGIPDLLVTDSQSNRRLAVCRVGNGFFNDVNPIVFVRGLTPARCSSPTSPAYPGSST